ncbi:MAG: hypothetical protein P2A85_29140 (plasmid) [Microcoleus anatoxicus]|uniref:hypothetical protein n=1 Tax=Microcoleus anatoxicus TaxID=2705319 RepID=UPI00366BA4AC
MAFPIYFQSPTDEIADGIFIQTSCSISESGVLTLSTRSWTKNKFMGARSRVIIVLLDESGKRLWNTDTFQCGIGGKYDFSGKSDRTINPEPIQVPQPFLSQVRFVEVVHFDEPKPITDYIGILNNLFNMNTTSHNTNTLTHNGNIFHVFTHTVEQIGNNTKMQDNRRANFSKGDYIDQKGSSIGIGVNKGKVQTENTAGTINKFDNEILPMIESLRQQIEALDNHTVRTEALEYLDDVVTEIQSSTPKQSRLKASFTALWNVVKDTALTANAVSAVAERFGFP